MHESRVIDPSFVAPLLRRGLRAEGETFAAVAPAYFMVGDDHMADSATLHIGPISLIAFARRGAVRSPDALARDGAIGGRRVGDCRERLFERGREGQNESFVNVVALSVGFHAIFRAPVEDNARGDAFVGSSD